MCMSNVNTWNLPDSAATIIPQIVEVWSLTVSIVPLVPLVPLVSIVTLVPIVPMVSTAPLVPIVTSYPITIDQNIINYPTVFIR